MGIEPRRVLVGLTLLGGGRFAIMLWASLTFADATAGPAPAPDPAEASVEAGHIAAPPPPARFPVPVRDTSAVSYEETR